MDKARETALTAVRNGDVYEEVILLQHSSFLCTDSQGERFIVDVAIDGETLLKKTAYASNAATSVEWAKQTRWCRQALRTSS